MVDLKYKDFIHTPFNPLEVQVRSTDLNRTVQSLSSQLIGFFPEKTGHNLTEVQLTTSIPPIDINQEVQAKIDSLEKDALPFGSNSFAFHIYHQLLVKEIHLII